MKVRRFTAYNYPFGFLKFSLAWLINLQKWK
jgi:hypothetical protein